MSSVADSGTRRAPVWDAPRSFPLVTAHAKACREAASTAESFQAALGFAVDYLEADVRFTAEGAAYLCHDKLPSGLQGRAMTAEDLLKLAASHPSVCLNLDMKEYSGLRALSGLIRRSGMASRVILTGLDQEALVAARGNLDGLPYLLNARPSLRQRFTASGAAELLRTIRACGAFGLNMHHRFVSRRLLRALSEAGLCASVWTVNGVRRMRRMIRLSVDNITTSRVDRLIALRERKAR